MIVLHIWRFNWSGRECADRRTSLERRGNALIGVVAVWWFLFLFNIIMYLAIAGSSKKRRQEY